MSANNSGVFGIEYEEVERVVIMSDDNWMSFTKSNSNGLMQTGQQLFQNGIKSTFTACWALRRKHAGPLFFREQSLFKHRIYSTFSYKIPLLRTIK